jgi:hypothetical protein
MSIDKIVVIALAVAFFGGVILLAIKGRRDKDSQSPSSPDQSSEGVALPFQPREKEPRKPKN